MTTSRHVVCSMATCVSVVTRGLYVVYIARACVMTTSRHVVCSMATCVSVVTRGLYVVYIA